MSLYLRKWQAMLACVAVLAMANFTWATTPDFSGKWLSLSTQDQVLTSEAKLPPLLPAAKDKLTAHQTSAKAKQFNFDPVTRCIPPGVPRIYSNNQPFLIVQSPTRLFVAYQLQRLTRQIYLQGTQPDDPDPAFMGNAIAHWDGETLIINTTGFKSDGLLDNAGTPYSKAMQITERWRLRDAKTLEAIVLINDASNFAAPWQTTYTFRKQSGTELLEDVCADRVWPERIEQQQRMEAP